MQLDQEQRSTLHEAIVASFDVADLRAFLTLRLGVPWDEVSGNGIRRHAALDTITYFEQRERLDDLVAALRDARPENATFRSFATTLVAPDTAELERVVFDQSPFVDPEKWDADAAAAAATVCLIEISGSYGRAVGTGFLIAPSLVLTARHVVEILIDGTAQHDEVRVWFDRKFLRNGKALNQGVHYGLADAKPLADDVNLDFAVLRLDGEAGAGSRGWLRVPAPPIVLTKGAPLIILQYPEGDPLKRALDMRSIAGFSPDKRRILHQTNTRPGSSGAPCFDAHWKLVAMHCGVAAGAKGYNEAVIIEGIAARLRSDGILKDAE